MNSNRKIAATVGILIIIAYSMLGTNDPNAKALGMFLEVISGFAVIVIAVLMFPLLKAHGNKMASTYLALKVLEGVIMVVAGVMFFIHTSSLLEFRDQLYLVHGYIFAIPAMLFYILLYRSKLIPDWLSIWGGIASVLLVIVNILEFFDIHFWGLMMLYLPIVLNELVLALLLLFKGFGSSTSTQFSNTNNS